LRYPAFAHSARIQGAEPGTTVVVYDFRLDGTCLRVRSLFRVVRANYVTIAGCTPLL